MKLNVSFCFSPNHKIAVGELWDIGRDMAFQYAPSFSGSGLSPSPFRLPVHLKPFVHDFRNGLETFGIFEDSLPDGWGRRLVDQRFHTAHGRLPTVLERLAIVGRNGRGALVYEPVEESGENESPFDFNALAVNAMDFDAGRADTALPQLCRAGGSSGGVRPKAFITYNPSTGEVGPDCDNPPPGFEHWLVKFNTTREGSDTGRREFAYYQMARAAGAEMSESRLLHTPVGDFFATQRFDRDRTGRRLHIASAAGLLHADFRIPGDEYEILFSLADALTHDYATKKELFRRTALNVLAHNRDDHLKNFAFQMDERGHWALAPFYDFTYADGPNGWQTLSVAGEGANPGLTDLRRLAQRITLQRTDVEDVIDRVNEAIKAIK